MLNVALSTELLSIQELMMT